MILSLFIGVKLIQAITGFNLKRMKKIARWSCSTKILKTNLKTMMSPLLAHPQECHKIWKAKLNVTKLKTILVSWRVKIQPKLNKIKKPSENRVSLTIFVKF